MHLKSVICIKLNGAGELLRFINFDEQKSSEKVLKVAISNAK